MRPVIRAEHVSKKFRIGAQRAAYSTLRDSLAEAARAPLRALRRATSNGDESDGRTVWALRDINFEIMSGEVVGLIGRNGAGKSTLLKILSRITEPTAGRVELFGRIGSLLEVGTGFHPELTGRDNVYLNGAILGMKHADIARKFDEIVAFSEIERYIDTPVKFYSSGMYVRLAFSVAAHLEPEILIIDEVLSVGDMAFRQKCLEKINRMREQIKAIILVSHDMIAVRSICSRVLLIKDGVVAKDGEPRNVIPAYEHAMLEKAGQERDEVEEGMGRIRVYAVRLYGPEGDERQVFEIGEPLRVVVEYNAAERVEDCIAYAAIRRPDGFVCVGTSTKLEGLVLPPLEGSGRVEVDIPELMVLPGYYVMDVTFYDQNFEHLNYFLGRKKVSFQITSPDPTLDDKYGIIYQKQRWTVKPSVDF